MQTATRTVNPLHFEDLEPHRFEDLVRQLAYSFRTWRSLEATGRLGKDQGVDIRGVEAVALTPTYNTEEQDERESIYDVSFSSSGEREWRIQCKRYRELGPKLVREAVRDAVPDPQEVPYGMILATACDVSADTLAAFREELLTFGIAEGHLWSKAHLEDLLFLPENGHLLFAYFGLSLGVRSRSRLQRIRESLIVKRKLLRALEGSSVAGTFMADVLVRDVDDDTYPEYQAASMRNAVLPWHVGCVERFGVRGILVCRWQYRGWVKEDGTWDLLEDSASLPGSIGYEYRRQIGIEQDADQGAKLWHLHQCVPEPEREWVRELWRLPFENILEVDPAGDQIHEGPHLYCRFRGNDGPYTGIPLQVAFHDWRMRQLDPGNRRPLFAALTENAKAPEQAP